MKNYEIGSSQFISAHSMCHIRYIFFYHDYWKSTILYGPNYMPNIYIAYNKVTYSNAWFLWKSFKEIEKAFDIFHDLVRVEMFYRILVDPSEGGLRNKFYLILLRYSIVDFTEINARFGLWNSKILSKLLGNVVTLRRSFERYWYSTNIFPDLRSVEDLFELWTVDDGCHFR